MSELPTDILDVDIAEDTPPPPAPTRKPRAKQRVLVPAAAQPGDGRGRTLPHSIEAEEYLLSCCLIDGADVVGRCRDAGIDARSFYDPKHGIIFARLDALVAERKPADIAVLAEDLKKSQELEQIGGYAFLVQVSSRLATTAQAGYFIETVRAYAKLRELIRELSNASESCFSFSGDIEGFMAEQRTRLERVMEGANIVDFADIAFDQDEEVPEARTAYWLKGTPSCRAGNLTTLTAAVKAGKSATVGAMLAAPMAGKSTTADCLGWVADNWDGRPLLHFDTEQSKEDWHELVKRATRRAGLERTPRWVHSFHLKGLPRQKKRMLFERTVREIGRTAPKGFFAIIIDGVADMVVDVNDPHESFGFIERLEWLSERYACPVICVIHLNPGKDSEKSRGHLGSELERKAESNILLEKSEDQVSTMWAPKQRKAAIMKPDGVRFQWDDRIGMHRLLTDEEKAERSDQAEQAPRKKGRTEAGRPQMFRDEEVIKLFPRGWPSRKPLGVILREGKQRLGPGLKDRTFYEYRSRLLQSGEIAVDDQDGRYYRPMPEDYRRGTD